MAKNRTTQDRHQQFINEYVQCWNATEAYRRVYPSVSDGTARTNAAVLLADTNISEEIKRRITEKAMGADEVLIRLGEHARGSLAPFTVQNGSNISIDLTTDQAKANIHLIKKISQRRIVKRKNKGADETEEEEDTTLTLEIHDAQAALNTLARHHGLLTDKTELTGKGGEPIQQKLIIEYVTIEDNAT